MKTEKSALIGLLLTVLCTLSLFPYSDARGQDKAPGSTFRDCDHCPEMVVIPAGTFLMGSTPAESDKADEKPQHKVSIANNFAVSKTEITFEQWDACTAAGRCAKADDAGYGRGNRPVINVSWHDVQSYVHWLSEITGKQYRLPSEAQFEYAARAGTATPWFWGAGNACAFADLYDQAGTQAHPGQGVPLDCNDGFAEVAPAGHYKPNAFGLYDVLGNVGEWVEDCHQQGYKGAPADGSVREYVRKCEKVFEGICMDKFDNAGDEHGACEERVVRGGSWADGVSTARAASRLAQGVDVKNDRVGFRVARDLE